MIKECPFNKENRCIVWIDCQIAYAALQKAETLCSANWNEINYLLDRVKLLGSLLEESGIIIPE